ncbi:MAG TPA: C-terminal helicase domain-containing protein, partial [Solirubrobacteraceae bacterium]|nr:C-terminal helicase domain-containing protein [Solirubrobacteraceae bacterium]
DGVKAVAMHGNKSQRQREQALSRFESGAVDTLVATDVAARGIDVERISHVINFDPPADSETYVHRVGRTGRAGRKGTGITLVSPDQHHDVTKLAGQLGLDHGLHSTISRRPERDGARHAAAADGRRSQRRRPSRRRSPTRG